MKTYIPAVILFSFVCFKSLISTKDENSNTFVVDDVYTIDLPTDWYKTNADIFCASPPDGSIAFNSAVYSRKNTTLDEFAELRFDMVKKTFDSLESVNQSYPVLINNKYRGIIQIFSGIKDKMSFYYFVLCIKEKDYLVSFTVTTQPRIFKHYEQTILNIINTISFKSELY